jgi:hypothetical protein
VTANTYASSSACERAEMACEEVLDREARQHLPSSGRFKAQYDRCSAQFRRRCVGPALPHNLDRLAKAWARESARFERDYNDRLLGGLVVISLVAILAFRFVVRVQLAETAGWLAFVFLQVGNAEAEGEGAASGATAHAGTLPPRTAHLTCLQQGAHPAPHACCPPPPFLKVYPRTFLGEASMYDKAWWQLLVRAWEAVVYNPGVWRRAGAGRGLPGAGTAVEIKDWPGAGMAAADTAQPAVPCSAARAWHRRPSLSRCPRFNSPLSVHPRLATQ